MKWLMRNFHFRAWDKKYKKMIGVTGSVRNLFSIRSDGTPSNENYILMQFTGLFDILDKEIYEGDIINILDHWEGDKFYENRNAIVKYEPPEFGLQDDIGIYFSLWDAVYNWDAKIIGNIYENPELLKKSYN